MLNAAMCPKDDASGAGAEGVGDALRAGGDGQSSEDGANAETDSDSESEETGDQDRVFLSHAVA